LFAGQENLHGEAGVEGFFSFVDGNWFADRHDRHFSGSQPLGFIATASICLPSLIYLFLFLFFSLAGDLHQNC